jgi:hypothetical protein
MTAARPAVSYVDVAKFWMSAPVAAKISSFTPSGKLGFKIELKPLFRQ